MSSAYNPEQAAAKVEHVDGDVVYLRMQNGNVFSFERSEEGEQFAPGDIVLVALKSYDIERAPEELWPTPAIDTPWVGVVVASLADNQVVVEINGIMLVCQVPPSLAVEIGNTVQGTTEKGVERVLVDKPVGRLESILDKPPDVSRYRKSPDSAPTYEEFGGYDQIKERTRELIELPLRNRDAFLKINAPAIRGVLFTGPSGTGKTMLGRIIAGHAKATFYLISGPEIISKYLGDSEGLIRAIFDDAKAHAPAIIFFDEIDSLAPQRSDESHEASRRLVGQLLTLMDGFNKDTNVMVIATTNRPEDVDVALRRPGRFDWQIAFSLPSQEDREQILTKSAHKLNKAEDLPHVVIAARTEGWTPAELAGIWIEAALLAVKDGREIITAEDYFAGHERATEQRKIVAASQKKDSRETKSS